MSDTAVNIITAVVNCMTAIITLCTAIELHKKNKKNPKKKGSKSRK